MSRWLAIVNCKAGGVQDPLFRGQWLPLIERAVDAVVFTSQRGEATQIARSAAAYDGIAVVGGDGTIYETLAGLDRGRQRLAIIPAGRGNDLARDLGVTEIPLAIDAIRKGEAQLIDLMHVEIGRVDRSRVEVLAASTVAIGYVASVVARANQLGALPSLAYRIASVMTRPRCHEVRVAWRGEPATVRLISGLVVNNTTHLANFPAFPRARLNDGLFEVATLETGWFRQVLQNLGLLTGTRICAPTSTTANAVSVALDEPSLMLIDGELIGDATEFVVTCLPRAIWCQGLPTA